MAGKTKAMEKLFEVPIDMKALERVQERESKIAKKRKENFIKYLKEIQIKESWKTLKRREDYNDYLEKLKNYDHGKIG